MMHGPSSSSNDLVVFLAAAYPSLPSEAYQVKTCSSEITTSGFPSPFKSNIRVFGSPKLILGKALNERKPFHSLSSSNSKYPLGSVPKLTNCLPPSASKSANCNFPPSPAKEGLGETNFACSN